MSPEELSAFNSLAGKARMGGMSLKERRAFARKGVEARLRKAAERKAAAAGDGSADAA